MKENSIERDIHLLESYAGMTHKMNDNQGRPKLDQAIEHILSDYKRVLKENGELRAKWDKDTHILQNKLDYANADRIDLAQQNKELRKENEELNYKLHSKKIALEIYNRYIPKSKVKEKIEELDKRIDFLNTELTKCYIEREKLGTETDIDNNETYIFYMEEEKNFREKQEEVLQELLEDGD